MKEPVTETFIIPTTYDDFRNWIASYGISKNELITAAMQFQPGTLTWWHYLQEGSIVFTAKIEKPKLLTVTATLTSRQVTNDDGVEYLIHEDEPHIIANFRELAEAIREEYPQTGTIPTISAAAPPWDRLAHKAEWTPEDWVYFFDHLIPNIPEGYPVTIMPNWPAMAALTVKFCDNPKKFKTIRERYHAVYTKQD